MNRYDDAMQIANEAVAHKFETLPTRRLLYQLNIIEGREAEAATHLEWAQGRARAFDLIGAEAQVAAYRGHADGSARALSRRRSTWRRRGLPRGRVGLRGAIRVDRGALRQPRRRQADSRTVPSHTAWRRCRARAPRPSSRSSAGPTGRHASIRPALQKNSTSTLIGGTHLPVADAMIDLARRRPADAVDRLRVAVPYELGFVAALVPAYVRGLALLAQGDGRGASVEFRKVLEHRGRRSLCRAPAGLTARPRPIAAPRRRHTRERSRPTTSSFRRGRRRIQTIADPSRRAGRACGAVPVDHADCFNDGGLIASHVRLSAGRRWRPLGRSDTRAESDRVAGSAGRTRATGAGDQRLLPARARFAAAGRRAEGRDPRAVHAAEPGLSGHAAHLLGLRAGAVRSRRCRRA